MLSAAPYISTDLPHVNRFRDKLLITILLKKKFLENQEYDKKLLSISRKRLKWGAPREMKGR